MTVRRHAEVDVSVSGQVIQQREAGEGENVSVYQIRDRIKLFISTEPAPTSYATRYAHVGMLLRSSVRPAGGSFCDPPLVLAYLINRFNLHVRRTRRMNSVLMAAPVRLLAWKLDERFLSTGSNSHPCTHSSSVNGEIISYVIS